MLGCRLVALIERELDSDEAHMLKAAVTPRPQRFHSVIGGTHLCLAILTRPKKPFSGRQWSAPLASGHFVFSAMDSSRLPNLRPALFPSSRSERQSHRSRFDGKRRDERCSDPTMPAAESRTRGCSGAVSAFGSAPGSRG
jgi:hypothetical protein